MTSGGCAKDRVVNPRMSANSTVTSRRSQRTAGPSVMPGAA